MAKEDTTRMGESFVAQAKKLLGEDKVLGSAPYPGEIHLETGKDELPLLAVKMCRDWGFCLIQLLAADERETRGGFMLYYTFAHDLEKFSVTVGCPVGADQPLFPSITPDVPAAHWYEREIRDLFGLEPQGHPDTRRLALHKDWPKRVYPLRRDFPLGTEVPRTGGQFSFKQVQGEGVMQIPVGPIHAGIIEPGHFRFSAVGENIINLEARLFYTHRGMEKLGEGRTPEQGLLLAERICGACSFSHAAAYCQAVEKLGGVKIPVRAEFIRTVALELERLYNHVGDVGNICAGIGFAFGTMHGARLKEDLLQLNEKVFGSRFLRGINTPGGVRRDLSTASQALLSKTLTSLSGDFRELTEILLSTESYLDRVQGTGVLKQQVAADLHAVGPAARAAGIDRDARRDYPHEAYDRVSFKVPVYHRGDVLARVRVRIDEVFESVEIIRQAIALMPEGKIKAAVGPLTPSGYAMGITESPRGENVHFVMGGPDGKVFRHMVRSASYCNWPVLPTTVPGSIVPDFPLINKSFELCYSCLDR